MSEREREHLPNEFLPILVYDRTRGTFSSIEAEGKSLFLPKLPLPKDPSKPAVLRVKEPDGYFYYESLNVEGSLFKRVLKANLKSTRNLNLESVILVVPFKGHITDCEIITPESITEEYEKLKAQKERIARDITK